MKTLLNPPTWAAVALLATLIIAPIAGAEELTVGQQFIQAYDKKDEKRMKELVKAKSADVPGEVKEMVEFAMDPGTSPRDRDYLFNIAGMMAKIYADHTNDPRLLNAVMANYEKVQQGQQAQPSSGPATLDPGAIEQSKKEISSLGGGDWRVTTMELDETGSLVMEIDVKQSNEAEPVLRVDFKKSQQARDLVKKRFPNIKAGKITWNSAGVGLKTIFLE